MELIQALLFGFLIHSGTFIFLKEKAHSMPVGVVVVAFLVPWYLTVPVALVGHVLSVLLIKKLTQVSDINSNV